MEESLLIFKKAEEIFLFVLQANGDETISTLPNTQFCFDLRDHLLNQMSARVGLAPEAQAFSFYINGGLDKRKLERNYIETMRSLVELYQMKGDNDQAVTLTAKHLDFQVNSGIHNL